MRSGTGQTPPSQASCWFVGGVEKRFAKHWGVPSERLGVDVAARCEQTSHSHSSQSEEKSSSITSVRFLEVTAPHGGFYAADERQPAYV